MSQEKRKRGRPKFILDEEEFKKLMRLHATITEVAGWFEVSAEAVDSACKRQFGMPFSECFKKFSAGGKISLRRAQWIAATERLNTSMLIWLGKQYLDQKDFVEHSVNQEKPAFQLAYAKPEPKQLNQIKEAVKEKIETIIEAEAKQVEETPEPIEQKQHQSE